MAGWDSRYFADSNGWTSVLVGRPDWAEDESLLLAENRLARFDELTHAIASRLAQQTVADILELAEGLRGPAAPLGNGVSALGFAHLRDTRHVRVFG